MGGGGNPPPPKTYSPQENAQAQMMLDEAAAARELAAEQRATSAAEQERQRVAAEAVAKRERTAGATNAAYNTGSSWGQQRLGNLGYADTFGLMDAYRSNLGAARSAVPESADNVGQYFDYEDLWSKATNQVQNAQRTKLSNQYTGMTPVGWEQGYFADTADDSILDAILGEQYGETFDTIDSARARGQLSEGGFQNTIRGLDQKKIGARATLEDMGLGVLGGYREELGGIADQYGDKVTNYTLGQNLDLGAMTGALNQRKTSLGGRMQGDIYRALGDTQLFNPETLLARGMSSAGVSNNPLRNAFRVPTASEEDPLRTSGTTGVF